VAQIKRHHFTSNGIEQRYFHEQKTAKNRYTILKNEV